MINKNHIDNDIMVTNCDIFTNFDLYDFYSFHKNDFDVTIVASDKNMIFHMEFVKFPKMEL